MLCFWEPGKSLKQIELEAIYQALEYHGGNKTHAARDLGISLRTIRIWLRDHEELAQFRGHDFGLPRVRVSREPVDTSAFRRRRIAEEREAISEALRDAGDNRAEAARILGMNRTTLVEKIRRYGLLSRERQAEPAPPEIAHEAIHAAPSLAPMPAPKAS